MVFQKTLGCGAAVCERAIYDQKVLCPLTLFPVEGDLTSSTDEGRYARSSPYMIGRIGEGSSLS